MGTPEQPSSRMCVQCGKSIPMDANVCQYCGKDYRVQPAPAKKQTVMPLIGGILVLISALYLIYGGVATAFLSGAVGDFMPVDVGLDSLVLVCGLFILVLGLIGLLGAIFAIQRKKWTLALIGAIFCLPSLYVIVPLVGLILIAVSKDEFS
ncbi:MAG: DUF2116 family Zn-ribbon domain-containing protein [Thermoplasmata archaeon]